MIRRFIFLKRKDGLSNVDFLHAWGAARCVGGNRCDSFWNDVDRYVQNRVRPAVAGVTPEPIWDGVAQVEMVRSPPDPAALRDDAWDQAIGPGEKAFVDPDRIVQFLAEDKVVLDGPECGVKIISLPRRRAGMSSTEFSLHYGEIHGALVSRNEAFVRYASRYVQHHVLPNTVKTTGGFVPYDGISEFWFASLDHARAAWASQSYMAELRADEKNFVGNPPSHRLIVDEAVFEAGKPAGRDR
jgi:hypothetical protein